MKLTNIHRHILCVLALCGLAGIFSGCSEDVDTSNRYTFTEETILSYLEKNPEYSQYVELLRVVPISNFSESTVAQLLSARGHYTCFAPNNEAIQLYLDSLQRKGIIPEPRWDAFLTQKSLDSIRKVIVYNSIIDGGDIKYFETSDFKAKGEDINIANMNDRKLSTTRGKINSDSIFINGDVPISMKNRDIEAINGRIHEVLRVIAPSNDTMADMLYRWSSEGGSGYTVMAKLLLACGLGDTMSAVRDEAWEYLVQTGGVQDLPKHNTFGQIGSMPLHRNYGFTVFAEIDELWEELLSKPALEISVEDVKEYLKGTGLFTEPGTTTDDDFENPNNILNQFVTYHVLPARVSRDKLVVHYNEKGYNFESSRSFTIAIADWYTTMGKPRLLKVYESQESNGIYLNRFPILRNGRGKYSVENENINDYHESGEFKDIRGAAWSPDENKGIEVLNPTDLNVNNESFVNGIFYPIRKMLICTDNVRTQMLGQRIRIDAATMFPEMLTNDLHGIKSYYTEGASNCRGIPVNYPYLAGVEMKEGTQFYYLPGLKCNWYNLEADEFNVIGRYEFTMKLPPVPKAGHYELRFGVATGTSHRGMCQVYWGTDKNHLPARGIPMDLRVGGLYRRLLNETQTSIVGWEADTDDEEYNEGVTKRMRNIGFMKAPEAWTAVPGSNTSVRASEFITRRIIVSEDMEPNKDYYIKFKSVLDDELKEFFMDYIEYCAKEVYDNPEESEDIW